MKKIALALLILGALLFNILAVSAFPLHVSQGANEIVEQENDRFDEIILNIMNHCHFPSVSACIIKDDQVVWSKGYGLSNIEQNYASTENTMYGLCSITKTITGTALMQLYDQGLFALDDDVNDYLPFSLRNPHFPDTPITFRMLLSHASSLRSPQSYWNVRFYHDGGPPFEGYPSPWIEEYLTPNGTRYDPDVWATTERPGESNVYANINFDLVGYLVELIAEEPFYEYCEEHIFKPLDMHMTSFNLSVYTSEQVAIPYVWDPSKEQYEKNYNEVHLHYPAGGLFSSVIELSHFMIAHMNGGVYNNTRILQESTVEEMHRMQHEYNGLGRCYGLAWLFESRSLQIGSLILNFPRLLYGGHGGAVTFGLRTTMYMKLSENCAVLFFINSDSFLYQSGWNGIQLIREMLFLKANTY
jgi:CubicO group peptidase (beta-lactamase class C family)